MDLNQKELAFPCEYPLKIVGLANPLFKKKVLAVIYRHFKQKITDDLLCYKKSRNEKYLSITVRFIAESRKQVDQIYSDLKECKEVLFLI